VLIRKLPDFTYDSQKSFRSWLRTIVLNKWRDQQRRKVAAGGDPAEFDVAQLAAPSLAEEFWEREHQQQLTARALAIMQAEFEETTWKACWANVVLGQSVAEVAAELGISRNAVYVAKSRVLRRLKQELRGLLD
jgi:RNA polymerase sigma-70 factor (ECF subfamily)